MRTNNAGAVSSNAARVAINALKLNTNFRLQSLLCVNATVKSDS